jgi:large subunit ribosomal protein L10
MSKAAAVFQALPSKTVRTVEALREKQENAA